MTLDLQTIFSLDQDARVANLNFQRLMEWARRNVDIATIPVGTPTRDDLVVFFQDGVAKKCTIDELLNL